LEKKKLSLIILLIFTLLLACTSKEKRLEEFISNGQKLMQKGEYKKAILEFKNALQLDPKNPKALFFLGKAYLAIKEFRKAYSKFLRVIEIDPNYDDARVEIASILVFARQPDEAIKHLKKIKDPKKYEPRISIIKARAFIIKEEYKKAADILLKVKNADKNKQIQMLLCLCYKKLGDFNKMIECVKRWREIDKKDPGSYIFLAQYWLQKGEKEKALKELDEMVKNNQSDELKLFYALSLEKLGFVEKAQTAFDKLPSKPDFLREKAKFYFRHKKIKKAEAILKELIKKDPKDVLSVIVLSEILFKTGRPELAYKEIDQSLHKVEDKKDREKLLFEKARLKALQGKLDEAKKLCQSILKEDQAMLDAHFLLGKILFYEGKLDDAEVHLYQVAVSRPNNVEAQILLSRCQFLNKKPSMAEDTLKDALSRMPKNQRLRLELVRFYLIRKRYKDAIKVLEKGISMDPKNIAFLKTKGEIELFTKEYEKAKADFEKIINIKPDSAIGFMELGRLYLIKKEYDLALDFFKKAYAKKDGINAFPMIIEVYLRKKDLSSAIKFCQEEIKRAPNSAIPYYFLGRIYLIKKDIKKAKDMFLKANSLAPNWQEPYRAIASIYLIQGKVDQAIAELEKTFKKRPNLQVGISLAMLYEYKKDFKKAEDIYNYLLKLYPNSAVLLNNLAYFYADHSFEKEKLKKARKLIARVLSRFPDNPNFLDTAAWIEYKLKNFNIAWAYIQDAVRNSNRDIIYLHAAKIAYKLGEKEEAQKYLNIAIQSINPEIRKEAIELKEILKKLTKDKKNLDKKDKGI